MTDDARMGTRAAGQPSNEATELVDGKVEIVEVSKHPEATIADTDLSLADIERHRSRPMRWAVYLLAVTLAAIAPYWLGRLLAARHTAQVSGFLSAFTPQGMAFVSWTVTLVAFTCLGMAVVDSGRWLWRILFAFAFAFEQLIAGASLLNFNFWYATYVVYGKSSSVANAANLGIIASGFALACFAVVWVGLLVAIRKDSPLNVLTRSWASFILFFVFEVAALMVVLFGGLLTTV